MSFFKNHRVYILTGVAYIGALLFGYDTGVMGSVLAMDSFKEDFGLPTDSSGFSSAENAHVSSNVVSLLTAGCFFGAILAAFVNDRFGRRFSLMGFCMVFLIGAAVQTAAHHVVGQIYGGRVIAGFGIGGLSSIMSVYLSENCPPNIRGRVSGLFQELLVIGSTFAYWLDYGVALHITKSTKQWRIPVGIQLIPGGLMFIGLFFLNESPRWLMKKGRHDEAVAALTYIRNDSADSPEIQKEVAEIRASIEEELAATEGGFDRADAGTPLLITAGAGGVGLNLTSASICIQTKIWWNDAEQQALCRIDQGQTKVVKYFRLVATNSAIDEEMLQVQARKNKVNGWLLQPLTCCHFEDCAHIALHTYPPFEDDEIGGVGFSDELVVD